MTGIGNGVYQESPGSFYVRPSIKGKRTWRKLSSVNARDAKVEASEIVRAAKMSAMGIGPNPLTAGKETVGELIEAYMKAGCPTKTLKDRPGAGIAFQSARFSKLSEWWGAIPLTELKQPLIHDYRTWRQPQITKGTGNRMIDMELQCLSNALNYAVATGRMDSNPLHNRPRFQHASEVSHCRDHMPKDGDELNWWAELFFSNPFTEVLGWQLLLEAMTGCRTSEVLALTWDAPMHHAGHISGNRLDIARAKSGINPWVEIHADLFTVINGIVDWRFRRGIQAEYWLPSRHGDGPLSRHALTSRLNRETAARGMPKRTSHGLRAYFVTKMRRDGHSDADVAAMIGDQTVSLIQNTYGQARPGEPKLSFRRADGTSAWEEFSNKMMKE